MNMLSCEGFESFFLTTKHSSKGKILKKVSGLKTKAMQFFNVIYVRFIKFHVFVRFDD